MRICDSCGRFGSTVEFIATHGCGDPGHRHHHDLCVSCWLWFSGIEAAGGEPRQAERGATAGSRPVPEPFALP